MMGSTGVWERESVAEAVDRLLARTRSGSGGALFVLGGAGLGKTTCLRHAGAVAAPDHVVGLGRGDVMESALPFGLVSQAFEVLEDPDLVGEAGADAPVVAAGAARASRFYRVLRRIREATTPLVFLADDLHWADPDSLALLAFLSRRAARLPVALVGALRPFPPSALQVCESLAHDDVAEIEVLAPLSRRSAGALLAARAGCPVDDDQVHTAWTSAGGNPLLLEQLARDLGRGEDRAPAESAGVGVLLPRFAGLPAEALATARAGSVLGVRFPAELATVLAGVDEQPAGSTTDALCRSGLFTAAADGSLEFVHPLFRQALYDEVPAPVRARLHASAFRILLARGRDAAAAEHALRADLADDPVVVEVLARAGTGALRAGALATAVRQLGTAVEWAGDRPAPDLLLAYGEALLGTAAPQQAVGVYDRLLSDPSVPVAARASALRMLGRAHHSMAAYGAASARFAEAVELIVDTDPRAAIEALLDEAMASWATVGPVVSLPLVVRARELGAAADPMLRARTAITWAFVAVLTGDAGGVGPAEAAYRALSLDPAAQISDLSWTWSTIVVYGHMLSFTERQAEAERVLTAASAAAERGGAVEAVASLAIARARLCHERGRLDEALVHARRAGELADLVPMMSGFVDVGLLAILYESADTAEADTVHRRVEKIADTGEFGALVVGWSVQARRLLDAGVVAAACELFARVEELAERLRYRNPCIWYWARYAAVAYSADGRLDDARRVISMLERSSADGLPCRWPRIAAHAGRAALAEATGDLDEADRRHRAALAVHEEVEVPLEHVETLLAYGAFLRRRGLPARARPFLADALARARHLGARRLTAAARDELSAAGGRRRQGRSEELTGQERRVARLAATGLANREIAAALSITVRTVEYHLGHAYAKLGLRSRRDLIVRADRLEAAPAEQ